jgi:AraC family transcriptional activator of mtrCDE
VQANWPIPKSLKFIHSSHSTNELLTGDLGVGEKQLLRIASSDLDNLLTVLDVSFVRLSECLVSPGWRLELGGIDAPGLHYNIEGTGRMVVGDLAIELKPHTLVILPARQHFRLEVPSDEAPAVNILDGRAMAFAPGEVRRYVAGSSESRIILICGYFRAMYGASMDLFASLSAPIVEQFDASDQLDGKLKSALAELVAQEAGVGAMTTSLLKQVLVVLLRRSLRSIDLWVERFPMFSDPHIARAFADMVTQPGAPHSIQSLSQSACLSRSAFMSHFTSLFGRAPMEVLREIRMRQAAALLANDSMSIEQIARAVGYERRSSFMRAFRKVYGNNPSDYRATILGKLEQQHPGGG